MSLVKLGESVVLPARSVKQVEALVIPASKGTISAVVERHDAFVRNYPTGFAVGRSIVKTDSSGRIPVQIANFGDKDLVVGKKTRLGYATEVENTTASSEINLTQSGDNEFSWLQRVIVVFEMK